MKPLLLLLFASATLLGDGLPFNAERTHVSTSATTLKLNPVQRLEVERSHYLTLTNEQWQLLKRIGRACPKRIPVLTSDYNDCTCGMGALAVWFMPGEVEIPHIYIPSTNDDADIEAQTLQNVPIIDPDGIFWLNNKKLKIQEIKLYLNESAIKFRADNNLSNDKLASGFVAAPPKTAIRDRAAIAHLVKELCDYAAKIHMRLLIPGQTKPSYENE